MEDIKSILIVLIAIVSVIGFLFIFTFEGLKEIVSVSGPLGDTFSSIFGFLTLIFVYKTFKDQLATNGHSKSAANLDVLLKMLERHNESNHYKITEVPEAFQTLPFIPIKDRPYHTYDVFGFTGSKERKYIESVTKKLGDLVLMIETSRTLHLLSEHSKAFSNAIEPIILNVYEEHQGRFTHLLTLVKSIHLLDKPRIEEYIGKDHNRKYDFIFNVNFFTEHVITYLKYTDILKELNILIIKNTEEFKKEVVDMKFNLKYEKNESLADRTPFLVENAYKLS